MTIMIEVWDDALGSGAGIAKLRIERSTIAAMEVETFGGRVLDLIDELPVFSAEPGPPDTPPCFSLPPAESERFPRGDHDE